ncbi:restriction endonuclease [Microbacterium sp. Clip185]|uniref:restriction endonuclease n=1 Tax=Microbacterium sp. Clip185 TaxID=3025663 RepID=UPI002366CBD4|nr:restriction endonuclease [Microbacterium sp. Clip185]WDG16772.1 restriction endonuclease [Microbacterium sp. Clip185]
MVTEARAWVVRGGRNGESDQRFLADNLVGIGFDTFGDLTPVTSREEMKARAVKALPDAKEASAFNYAAQAWAFRGRIEAGDLVVVPLKNSPHIAIGRIVGDYQYVEEGLGNVHHTRAVEWLRTDIPRTVIGKDLLYSIGAFSTVVQVQRNDAAYRLGVLAASEDAEDPGERSGFVPKRGAASASADEADLEDAATESGFDIDAYVSDRITARIRERFDGHRLSQLVGAILEAEGFVVQVSPPGADGGVDILAGRGLFGMDSPRVVVQVKSEPKAVSDTVVAQLHGAVTRNSADQGLLVAMGGVTKPAEHQLVGQKFRIAVWDAARLQRAIFENYEALPADVKADLPLRRAWVLAE